MVKSLDSVMGIYTMVLSLTIFRILKVAKVWTVSVPSSSSIFYCMIVVAVLVVVRALNVALEFLEFI